jgi:predicted outer membrane repeat protein
VTLTNATLAYNRAIDGGGLYASAPEADANPRVTLTNATFAYNTALRSGGGLAADGHSVVTLTNATLAYNSAPTGGGLASTPASSGSLTVVAVQNTILALNAASSSGPECVGPVTSYGHNLLGDPTGCPITLLPSDRIGDPQLNGGRDEGTPGRGYFPLLPNSPAIDAGNPEVCPPTDQLGQLRVTPCDIGAVEFAPVTLTLGLNQATFRPGDTLQVRLGLYIPGPTVTADAYFGILWPDGVTVLFITNLAPLEGVVTRLDADPRTFAPLAAAVNFSAGEEATVEDFFVYTITGGEASGAYALFTLLTPPGAFADGQGDAGDVLAQTLESFTISR